MLRNTHRGWGLVSIIFHWISAIVIVGLFALGWWMTGLGYYDAWYNQAPNLHRSVAILLALWIGLRLLWRSFQPRPEADGNRLEVRAARMGHALLYGVLIISLTSGYLMSTAKGAPISVFGWFEVPALLHGYPDQARLAGDVHWYSALLLMSLVSGHALAALKHHYLDRRDTLRRMLDPRHAHQSAFGSSKDRQDADR